MPIFEYQCEKCGYVQEFLEKSRGPGKHRCPQCKDVEMKKKFSTFSCSSGTSSSGSGGSASCPTGTCPFS